MPPEANSNLPAETTLAEALVGADVFVGLSKGNTLKQEMVKKIFQVVKCIW